MRLLYTETLIFGGSSGIPKIFVKLKWTKKLTFLFLIVPMGWGGVGWGGSPVSKFHIHKYL